MIALDLDGVLVDFRDIFAAAGERMLRRSLPPLNEDTYNLKDQLGLSTYEERAIWQSPELREALLLAPAMNHRVRDLLDAGSHCFLTSRSTSDLEQDHANLIRMNTRRWLRNTFCDYSEIHFISADQKTGLAMDLGIRVAYEDYPDTALAMAEAGIRVHMPVYGYNRHLVGAHRLITPLHDWREPRLMDLLTAVAS